LNKGLPHQQGVGAMFNRRNRPAGQAARHARHQPLQPDAFCVKCIGLSNWKSDSDAARYMLLSGSALSVDSIHRGVRYG
jgi:hypothetical protein